MIPYLHKGQGNTVMNNLKDLGSKTKMVYCSEPMEKAMKIISKIALTDASVLIFGSSGTGKELAANYIHSQSYRKNKPFVVINCGCLNEETDGSELFGHERGSFTGADQQKAGLLEQANGGTVVLDGINDLKPRTQAKLLRFLQEGEIQRIGGKHPIMIDVRVISIANKNLGTEVVKGNFREDLFYRINTIIVSLPTLSERLEDIPLLLKYFLGKKIQVTSEVLDILFKYNWPGNVRELKNLCERLRIFCSGNVLKKEHLPKSFLPQEDSSNISYNPKVTLSELNKMYILSALNHFSSKREAARALGITVKTLYNRLHEYKLFKQYSVHSDPETSQIMEA